MALELLLKDGQYLSTVFLAGLRQRRPGDAPVAHTWPGIF